MDLRVAACASRPGTAWTGYVATRYRWSGRRCDAAAVAPRPYGECGPGPWRGPVAGELQPVEPELPMLRTYSKVSEVRRMGDRGEDFAALVQVICKDGRAKDAYLSWLRQLRPEEVDDVRVRPGAMGEPLFVLQENGREFPAAVLSDGTLRFAALGRRSRGRLRNTCGATIQASSLPFVINGQLFDRNARADTVQHFQVRAVRRREVANCGCN